MTVTYTPAAERDLRRTRRATRPRLPDALLFATSLVVALGIALGYLGRMGAFDLSETPGNPDRTVNLNTARKAVELEAPLTAVFPERGDRVFAANELFRFIAADPAKRAVVPNVGAIARATAGTESIARAKNLHVFADRLKERTATAGTAALPDAIPLLTPAEVAILKPFLVVRTRDEFTEGRLCSLAAYTSSRFTSWRLSWRCGAPGRHPVAVGGGHLLTGIGFAVSPQPARSSAR